jgi:hypothetical protein
MQQDEGYAGVVMFQRWTKELQLPSLRETSLAGKPWMFVGPRGIRGLTTEQATQRVLDVGAKLRLELSRFHKPSVDLTSDLRETQEFKDTTVFTVEITVEELETARKNLNTHFYSASGSIRPYNLEGLIKARASEVLQKLYGELFP